MRKYTLLLLMAIFLPIALWSNEKPRLIITTDIGGDPDDIQSLIRLLVYTNEFEIEGMIASAAGSPGDLKVDQVMPQLIHLCINAYESVWPNLLQHDSAYASPSYLRSLVKSGNPHRGMENIGEGMDTEGSDWIIQQADDPDPRPLNISVWGGTTDLAQALWRVKNSRDTAAYNRFIGKLRIYDINQQDNTGDWIVSNHSNLFYILAKAAPDQDKREGAYRGMYLGGDESLTSALWIQSNVRQDHGALGLLYPDKTWTEPNPHGVMKEGDTPSWFYFLPIGLSDPEHPEWGCWGGRFELERSGIYRDAMDSLKGVYSARTTVYRWRPAFQADFQARMDWCVKDYNQANHAPRLVLNGDSGNKVVVKKVKAGSKTILQTKNSMDPDGNSLQFRWWIYKEPSQYYKSIRIDKTGNNATVFIPQNAKGKNIHLILEGKDNGSPALTSYRRIILEVR